MYLTQKHFNNSLIAALVLHLFFLIFYAANFNSDDQMVLDKAIFVKLGNNPKAGPKPDKTNSVTNREAIENAAKPAIKAPITQPQEVIPEPVLKDQSSLKVDATEPIQATEKIKINEPKPAKKEKVKISNSGTGKFIPTPTSRPDLPPLVMEYRGKEMTKNPPASMTGHGDVPFVQNLQSNKYEVEGVAGSLLGNRTEAEQLAIEKYEQTLALWIEKHHVYPLSARNKGLEGEAVARLQIDRLGNIRFYELSEETKHDELNQAVLKMIERSDPVPPIPDDYPGDFVMEFLIPINFKLRNQPASIN